MSSVYIKRERISLGSFSFWDEEVERWQDEKIWKNSVWTLNDKRHHLRPIVFKSSSHSLAKIFRRAWRYQINPETAMEASLSIAHDCDVNSKTEFLVDVRIAKIFLSSLANSSAWEKPFDLHVARLLDREAANAPNNKAQRKWSFVQRCEEICFTCFAENKKVYVKREPEIMFSFIV